MTRASLLGLSMLLACSRSEPRAPLANDGPAQAVVPSSAAAPASGPPLSDALTRPAPAQLVAIGDLHGDLDATRRAFRLAGALGADDHWVGGALVVVQTGDCIDRGEQDREVLDLLNRLRDEAKQAGGELILLNGNHELMNIAHDFRYVAPASNAAFTDQGGRPAAFEPAGSYARLLATHPLFIKVGDSVFVHGGVLKNHVAYGLDRMDNEARAWARGELPTMPAPLASNDGVIWTRAYSDGAPPPGCAELREVLEQLSAKRMVVGHTVQMQGINAACDGQVVRIDVGLSKYYGGPMQVLEIAGSELRIRREEAPAPQPPAPASPTTNQSARPQPRAQPTH